jgi:hypothetical protein
VLPVTSRASTFCARPVPTRFGWECNVIINEVFMIMSLGKWTFGLDKLKSASEYPPRNSRDIADQRRNPGQCRPRFAKPHSSIQRA